MRLRVSAIFLAIFGIMLAVGVTHVERFDTSYLVVTQDSVYDFIGMAREKWNSMTRDCDDVALDSGTSDKSKAIENYLNLGLVQSSGRVTVLTTAAQLDWYLVEVEFESLEPALLLLRYEQGKYVWFKDATWSGNPGPWVAGPIIREFIGTKVPSTPKQLLQCFKPRLSHFQAQVWPNPSLKRTLHSVPAFGPSFHSGPIAVPLFRAA
jgi:hypothetical protein